MRTEVVFEGDGVRSTKDERKVTLGKIAAAQMTASVDTIAACASNGSPISPPPFMAGCAEIDLDPQTGAVEVVDYVGVVDCGTVINPQLARVQTEGGIMQGIGTDADRAAAHGRTGTDDEQFLPAI